MTEHTFLPLKHGEGICRHKIYSIPHPEYDEVARCYSDTREQVEDFVSLIVTACNCHAELLEALEAIKAECFVRHSIEGPEKNVHNILEMSDKAIRHVEEQA